MPSLAFSTQKVFLFRWLSRKVIVEIIAMLYILLFLYTGLSKFLEQDRFIDQLASSDVLEPFSVLIGWGLPAVELLISILLFFPKWRRIGLYASVVLMTTFTIYISILLVFSDELPCSCGGIIELLSWPAHFILNIIFIVLGIVALKLTSRSNTKNIIS